MIEVYGRSVDQFKILEAITIGDSETEERTQEEAEEAMDELCARWAFTTDNNDK
jgi:hypothetical protein